MVMSRRPFLISNTLMRVLMCLQQLLGLLTVCSSVVEAYSGRGRDAAAAANDKFVLFVLGVHHAGTGYLRAQLQSIIPNSTTHQKVDKNNNQLEGQHVQTLYGTCKSRLLQKEGFTARRCRCSTQNNVPLDQERLCLQFYCPGLFDSYPSQKRALLGETLLEQWASSWENPDSQVYITKDPDLLVDFKLKSFPRSSSAAVITIRHPFSLSFQYIFREKNEQLLNNPNQLLAFLKFYSTTLNRILHQYYHAPRGKLAIVRYEDMMVYSTEICQEIFESFGYLQLHFHKRKMLLGANNPGSTQRRLELHDGLDAATKAKEEYDARLAHHQKLCLNSMQCMVFLKAEPFKKSFGYSLRGDFSQNSSVEPAPYPCFMSGSDVPSYKTLLHL